jgi:hypothetical protein
MDTKTILWKWMSCQYQIHHLCIPHIMYWGSFMNSIERVYEFTNCRTEICGKKVIEWLLSFSKYEIFNYSATSDRYSVTYKRSAYKNEISIYMSQLYIFHICYYLISFFHASFKSSTVRSKMDTKTILWKWMSCQYQIHHLCIPHIKYWGSFMCLLLQKCIDLIHAGIVSKGYMNLLIVEQKYVEKKL